LLKSQKSAQTEMWRRLKRKYLGNYFSLFISFKIRSKSSLFLKGTTNCPFPDFETFTSTDVSKRSVNSFFAFLAKGGALAFCAEAFSFGFLKFRTKASVSRTERF